MIKTSYIKKLPNGDYRVFSEKGKNLGTYTDREDAEKRLKQIEMFKHMKRKKKASYEKNNVVDLTGIDSFSFSAILRELRQTASTAVVNDFLKIFKITFDKQLLSGIDSESIGDKALVIAVKFLDKKYGVVIDNVKFNSFRSISAPRFTNVVDQVYRGGAPTINDVEVLRNNFGIKRIVSLDSSVADNIKDICKNIGIQHVVLPVLVKDFKTVSNLPNIDWSRLLRDGGPTYVHCLHGKDRTGLAVALFRCQEGMLCKDSIKEADFYDFCLGLPNTVRRFFCTLLTKVCPNHQKCLNDSNSAFDPPVPDYVADYKYNNGYNLNDNSFAIRLYDVEGPLGRKNPNDYEEAEVNNKESIKDIPSVGLIENVSNVATPGPAGVGYGYIAFV